MVGQLTSISLDRPPHLLSGPPGLCCHGSPVPPHHLRIRLHTAPLTPRQCHQQSVSSGSCSLSEPCDLHLENQGGDRGLCRRSLGPVPSKASQAHSIVGAVFILLSHSVFNGSQPSPTHLKDRKTEASMATIGKWLPIQESA